MKSAANSWNASAASGPAGPSGQQVAAISESVLVLNAGSSSLKFSLFDSAGAEPLAAGQVDWSGDARPAEFRVSWRGLATVREHIQAGGCAAASVHVLRVLSEGRDAGPAAITAVGHRVVHGGTALTRSVRIDDPVKSEIARLAELAPLHNVPALEVIEATEKALPSVPQIAVFDTAFFDTLPASAYIYPVPFEWFERYGVRRFGFHGISHAYCAARAADLLERDAENLRVVICHLGNGCSASAVRNGRAAATSMGFTPLDGLAMGTRPGTLDPGVLVYLQRRAGLTLDQLERALQRESGLLGVSGVSASYSEVEAAVRAGNERAGLALAIYQDRVRSTIGGFAAQLGGLDALVFTAGVGENAASLRAAVCRGLDFMGLRLDRRQNESCHPDCDIAAADSKARILVIHTREDLMIAREARRVHAGPQ